MWKIVTGGAGFIGSNLVRALLKKGERVKIIDNFSTGRMENIRDLFSTYPEEQLQLIVGSITDTEFLMEAFQDSDVVFHQAAIPSVQKSIDNPVRSNHNNITGTLSVLMAARNTKIKRIVYAASSSAYGDTPTLPKTETMRANPLSPYALTKYTGEEYCRIFTNIFGLETVSLRYFNIFGPMQDPQSQYAAVIPKFITRMIKGKPPIIYGDGKQSRDFTYVDNVIKANILAATCHSRASGKVFNIACGRRINLLELVSILNDILKTNFDPIFAPPRKGDVKHSLADIAAASEYLGYKVEVEIKEGLEKTVEWFRRMNY